MEAPASAGASPPAGPGKRGRSSPRSRRDLARVALTLLALACLRELPRARAQEGSAAIMGQLVDRQTRAPIRGATVLILGTPAMATSDTAGRFEHTGLARGYHILQARAVGYTMGAWQVGLGEGEVLSLVLEMQPADPQLPPIEVVTRRGEVGRRFEEFERRRERGQGHFITREQIVARNPNTLTDILRTVRGVRAECSGSSCILRMGRAVRSCEPEYFLDGFASSAFIAGGIPPLDVQGIEVYRGASETPAEFIGSSSGCGVISVWTRSAP